MASRVYDERDRVGGVGGPAGRPKNTTRASTVPVGARGPPSEPRNGRRQAPAARIPSLWQSCPKLLAAENRRLTAALSPEDKARLRELDYWTSCGRWTVNPSPENAAEMKRLGRLLETV